LALEGAMKLVLVPFSCSLSHCMLSVY